MTKQELQGIYELMCSDELVNRQLAFQFGRIFGLDSDDLIKLLWIKFNTETFGMMSPCSALSLGKNEIRKMFVIDDLWWTLYKGVRYQGIFTKLEDFQQTLKIALKT